MAAHGSSLSCKVDFLGIGENRLKRFKHLSSTSLKPYNVFLGSNSSTQYGHAKLQIGTTSSSGQASRLLSLRECKVLSEDSEEMIRGEKAMYDEENLARELNVAIEEEDYEQAAKIRDRIREIQEDSKASVLSANARFYHAFRMGHLGSMQRIWVKGDHVCCVHPSASGVIGYDDVIESWEVVWMNYDFPLEIKLKNVQVHFRGDLGYVTCVEFVKTKGNSWGAQFVTNVFERIDDSWFMCIHHASPVDL